MKLESVIVTLVSMVTTFYPVGANEELAPKNPDNLDPGAAHVCQEVETEAYTKRMAYIQYYKQKTSTWCVAFPPRCTEYRIQSRTSYRIETHYRDRKHYFCCEGYKSLFGRNYCIPKCLYDCYLDENKGYCVTPDRCICHPGYKGEYCESGCDKYHWGPDCNKTCNCGTFGSCDPTNGNCICSIGYTGQDCSQKCDKSFGLNCVHPCVCENDAICDNVNGKCTCKDGYFGAYCHKKCNATTVEQQGCEQVCPCQNGGVCDEITKNCICPPGVKGKYCTEFCDAYHWGPNCTSTCQCNFGTCNRTDGNCTCDHGYIGESCNVKCLDGFFGPGCLTPCGCENGGECFRNDKKEIECNCANTGFRGHTCSIRECSDGKYLSPGAKLPCRNCMCNWSNTDSCHPLNGSCLCKPGYKGNQCTEKCSMPFYGKDCASVCECANGDCDHVTGECTTCYPGYLGKKCDVPCQQGLWGLNCTNSCTCVNGALCHVKSGYCECKPGYAGLNCEKYCKKDKYGPGCTEDCTCNKDRSTCSPVNGQCLCNPGYTGEQCQYDCSPGKYGYYCISDCDCSEQGTESCDPKTGFCHCRGGWSGKKCDILCGNNNWGPNCVNTCNCNGNGYCDGKKGSCRCFDGYRGDRCELDENGVVIVEKQTGDGEKDGKEGSNSLPLIIGIVVPCIILLIILALVIAFYMRKVRFLKDENLRVRYEANGTIPPQTAIPNGNAIGVDNPMYVADNDRNERRYPHLSHRASAAPPPLPHRQQSCDPCDDIDVEKLRVQMDSGRNRPVSSQYADIDDVEDRYTTLKSVSGAALSTTATADSESGGFQFYTGRDGNEGQGHRSRSSSRASEASGGYSNKAYVDMTGSANTEAQSLGGFSQPLYDNKEQNTNGTSLDQPDALSSPASADSDQNSAGYLMHQVPREYDFPKSTRLSSVNTEPDLNESQGYMNSTLHPPMENADTKKRSENPYDTPNNSVPTSTENTNKNPNGYLTPTINGYLTPKNDVNTKDTFA